MPKVMDSTGLELGGSNPPMEVREYWRTLWSTLVNKLRE